MDIDKPTSKDSFNYRVLKQLGYPVDKHDDENLHLVGMTGIDSPNTIELFLVNAKPSRDANGELLDQAAVGANSTIEKFVTGPAATSMKHVKTFASSNIATPNNIATAPGMKGFYFTNDHGPYKTGFRHTLSQFLKQGDVSYCDTTNPGRPVCMKLVSGINFPNGLLYHPEHSLLYVPSAATGNIHVFRPSYATGSSMPTLSKVHEIMIPYPIDNLSLDPYTGDIYAPGFPAAPPMMAGFEDPLNVFAPSTHHRVRLLRHAGGKLEYEVEKVLEHGGGIGSPFSGMTTIIRDGKTGRLFLSGKSHPTLLFLVRRTVPPQAGGVRLYESDSMMSHLISDMSQAEPSHPSLPTKVMFQIACQKIQRILNCTWLYRRR